MGVAETAIAIAESYAGSDDQCIPGKGFLTFSMDDPEHLLVSIDHLVECFITMTPEEIDGLIRHGAFIRFIVRLIHLPLAQEAVQYSALYLLTTVCRHCSFVVYPELAAAFARYLTTGSALLQSRALTCIMEIIDASDDFCDILLAEDDVITACMDILTHPGRAVASPLRVSALCVCLQTLRKPSARAFLLQRFPTFPSILYGYAATLHARDLVSPPTEASTLVLEAIHLSSLDAPPPPVDDARFPLLAAFTTTTAPDDQLRALVVIRAHVLACADLLDLPDHGSVLGAVVRHMGELYQPAVTLTAVDTLIAVINASPRAGPLFMTIPDFLPALLVLLRDPPTADHSTKATALLQALAADEGFISAITEHHPAVFTHLMHLVESASSATKRSALIILTHLAQVPQNAATIVNAGLLPPLVRLLAGIPTVAQAALVVLLAVSTQPQHVPLILKAGILDRLPHLAETAHPAMIEDLLAMLWNVATVPEARVPLASAGPVLDLAARALTRDSPTDPDQAASAQLSAANLLWNVSCDPEALPLLRAHQTLIPDVVTRCLRTESTHPRYHSALLSIVTNMSRLEFLREGLLSIQGLLPAAVALGERVVAKAHPEYAASLFKPLATLLIHVSSTHPATIIIQAAPRVPRAMFFLLEARNPATRLTALQALVNMASHVPNNALATLGGAIIDVHHRSGLLGQFIEAARAEDAAPGTDEAFAGIMCSLAKLPAARTVLCDTTGMLDQLTTIVADATHDTAATLALDAVCKLSFVPQCRPSLVSHPTLIKVLTGALAACPPPRLAASAATVLWCLSLELDARPHLLRSGVVQATAIHLHAVFGRRPDALLARTAEGLLSTLWDLAIDPAAHPIFATLPDLVPALLWSLTLPAPKIVRAAVSLMSHLSATRELQAQLIGHPDAPALVHQLVLLGLTVMGSTITDRSGFMVDPAAADAISSTFSNIDPAMATSIVTPLVATLANMSAREEAARAIGAPAATRTLLCDALLGQSEAVAHTAAVLLYNLSASTHRVAMAQDSSLVRAVLQHLTTPGVPSTTCSPLARSLPALTFQSAAHDALVSTEGLLDTCLGLLRMAPDGVSADTFHTAGATALWNLSASPSTHAALTTHPNMFATIEQLLRANLASNGHADLTAREVLSAARAPTSSADDEVASPAVVAALSMLCNLATGADNRLAIAARPGLLEALVGSLHHPSKQVRTLSRQCISRLFDSGNGGASLLPYLESLVRGMRETQA